VGTVVSDVQGLTRFSMFLSEAATDVEALAGIDRACFLMPPWSTPTQNGARSPANSSSVDRGFRPAKTAGRCY
jgi:hypothetical protein